ncbi:MAG: hypothetical protein FD180_3186 [Planctomycetota bacterium]|nr:MAG: hypothetical protein FD180_3186 [Planctomycetota bacterium]
MSNFDAGSVFLAQRDGEQRPHWRFLISPKSCCEMMVAVNATSWHQHLPDCAIRDGACFMPAGIHDVIEHDSCLLYAMCAPPWKLKDLERGLTAGIIRLARPLSPSLYKMAVDGFRRSKFVAEEIKLLLISQGVLR